MEVSLLLGDTHAKNWPPGAWLTGETQPCRAGFLRQPRFLSACLRDRPRDTDWKSRQLGISLLPCRTGGLLENVAPNSTPETRPGEFCHMLQ